MSRRALPPALAVAAVLAAALPAEPARAGRYTVTACVGDQVNRAWRPLSSTAGMGTATDCPARTPFDRTGIVQRTVAGHGLLPFLSVSGHEFAAPPGSRLGAVKGSGSVGRADGAWTVGLMGDTDDNPINGADMLWGNTAGDSHGAAFGYSAIPIDVNAGGRPRVRMVAACGSLSGCPSDGATEYPVRAWANLGPISVEVLDDTAPALAATGSLISPGTWHRGTEVLSGSATDAAGVRVSSLSLDGTPVDIRTSTCDEHLAAPCPGRSDFFGFDTARLADGTHTARFAAMDPAGNVRFEDHPIAVDNTPPGRPQGLSVAGGEGWRAANGFDLAWAAPPGQVAPIVAARYRLCAVGGTCTEDEVAGAVSSLQHLEVPAPGAYRVSVWLEDAAGNADPAFASDPVTLRFDDTVPGAAAVDAPAKWLTAPAAAALRPGLALEAGAAVGPSGIAGYSVTSDGSAPDATIDIAGSAPDLRLGPLPEGITTVRARAVSGAGVPATEDGAAAIRVDATAPAVSASGVPGPEWHQDPVAFEVTARDQALLSGMEPAAEGEPVTDGGFVTVRVDGTAVQQDRGDTALVRLAADGEHVVTYAATDAAGNESRDGTATVRIDGTPPETLGFLAPDPADPRALAARAFDRHSGVVAGTIQVRRVGEDRWRSLDTALSAGRLAATLDEDALPRGTYRVRVLARDAAGNVRSSDRMLDGAAAGEALVVEVPVRTGTALAVSAAGAPRTRRTCRSVRVPAARGRGLRTVRRCRTVAVAPGAPVRVPFGRPLAVAGLLLTADGAPVAGQAITVTATAAVPGAPDAVVATARTGADGRFAYRAPAGSSRTLRFGFGGTARLRPASESLAVAVPAAVRLAPSRRSLRNGEAVRFSGRLAGSPAGAGKLVEIQAHFRGRWRTFATVGAGANGRFAYTYRFGATVGRVSYRFRAVARREAGYPYEAGVSPVVRVTVTG